MTRPTRSAKLACILRRLKKIDNNFFNPPEFSLLRVSSSSEMILEVLSLHSQCGITRTLGRLKKVDDNFFNPPELVYYHLKPFFPDGFLFTSVRRIQVERKNSNIIKQGEVVWVTLQKQTGSPTEQWIPTFLELDWKLSRPALVVSASWVYNTAKHCLILPIISNTKVKMALPFSGYSELKEGSILYRQPFCFSMY